MRESEQKVAGKADNMAGKLFSERREERRGKGKNWRSGGRYLRAKTGGSGWAHRGAFRSFEGQLLSQAALVVDRLWWDRWVSF